MMAKLTDAEPLAMALYRPLEAAPGTLRFKLFRRGGPVTLSDSLPMLENMGLKVLDERPYRIAPEGPPAVWMHDLGLAAGASETEIEVDTLTGLHARANWEGIGADRDRNTLEVAGA